MPLNRSLLAFAVASVVAAGCTEPSTPTLSLTVTNPTVTLAQGGDISVPLQVTRSGFAGAVSLAATGLPTGVTATFDPPTLSESTTSGTLALAATGTALAGEHTITVTASGAGVESSSASVTFTITVTGNFMLGMQPSPLELYRDIPDAATISISRMEGFAQPVTLAATNLPDGVTATITPSVVTGSSATIAFTVSGSAALGDHAVVIQGTTPGLPAFVFQTPTTIAAAPSTESFSYDFCSEKVPTWVAYQNQGGAWTRVVPDASHTVTFDATPKFSLAVVFGTGSGSEIAIHHVTRVEAAHVDGVDCVERTAGGVGGELAGVSDAQRAAVSLGTVGGGGLGPITNWSIVNPVPGVMDLVASRSPKQPDPYNADRVVIRRAQQVPEGSPYAAIDFDGGEAFTPATFTLTLTGVPSASETMVDHIFRARSTGTTHTTLHRLLFSYYLNTPVTVKAIPLARLDDADRHYLFVSSVNPPYSRGTSLLYREPGNLTLALGDAIELPTLVEAASAPYARHEAGVAAGDYTGAVRVMLGQSQRFHTIWVSSAFLGAAPPVWTVTMPDFTGVDGWNPVWGMQAGAATNVGATIYSPGVLPFTEAEPRGPQGTAIRWATYLPNPF